MKNPSNRGFTLIELLVVITIIAILAGLLITLIPEVMLKVKIADTNVRMNAVHSGMAMIGQDEGSATFRLQQRLKYSTTGTALDAMEPGLGGVITFGPPNAGFPTIGNGAWGTTGGRGHLASPWGKKSPSGPVPEAFRLRQMSPFNTRKILNIANILEKKSSDPAWGENQYMTNRKTSVGWNDAWGHPLVVASVLYQPVTSQAVLDHLKRYQYNRSVYIAVAAVGPSARVSDIQLKSTTLTDWANSPSSPTTGILDILWSQANNVCQQAKKVPFDKDWSELSFDNPPWQGNKYDFLTPTKKESDYNWIDPSARALVYDGIAPYTGKTEHCMLSAPLEYK